MLEDTPFNKQDAQSTQVGKSFTSPVLSHGLFIATYVAASLSTEVSNHDVEVLSWAVSNDRRQSAVQLFSYILITVICWDITLDDIHADLPFLDLKGSLENP